MPAIVVIVIVIVIVIVRLAPRDVLGGAVFLLARYVFVAGRHTRATSFLRLWVTWRVPDVRERTWMLFCLL